MQLHVAGRMQKNPVGCMMCASFALPNNVMVMPSRDLGDFLLAHRTYPVLFLPEMPQLPSSRQVPCHSDAETLFKVHFPCRVERVCFPMDDAMPLNFHLSCSSQMDQLLVSFLIFNFSGKHPVHRSNRGKVFLLYPSGVLAWVPPSGPPPQLFEDCIVHGVKG